MDLTFFKRKDRKTEKHKRADMFVDLKRNSICNPTVWLTWLLRNVCWKAGFAEEKFLISIGHNKRFLPEVTIEDVMYPFTIVNVLYNYNRAVGNKTRAIPRTFYISLQGENSQMFNILIRIS